MSLARLKNSWIDVSKLSSTPKSTMEYLTFLRESNEKSCLGLGVQNKNIDVLAMSYLIIPQYKESALVTALLVRDGITGEFIKILSNIIPKDVLAKLLNISKKSLSNQYKRKSLNKLQTESVVGFIKIWSELMSLFKNRDDVVTQWLIKEKGPLCGNSPINLMDTGPGREAVSDMIYRVKTGDLS